MINVENTIYSAQARFPDTEPTSSLQFHHISLLPAASLHALQSPGSVPLVSAFVANIRKVVDFFRIMDMNKVMDCAKCWWKADLQFHVVLRWVGENREASFEYAENTLDDVARASVLKIEEFLFIRGPESNEKRVIKQ
jgi:hypothetical protein